MDQLSRELDRTTYLELSSYVTNNPEDPLGPRLSALVAPMLDAETPVTVKEAWLQDRRLPGFRDARVTLTNASAMPVSSVTVRFELRHGAGRALRNVDGEEGLAGTLTEPMAPGDELSFGVPGAGVLLFPDASSVKATPTRVVYQDGSVWTHPAVEQGLWR